MEYYCETNVTKQFQSAFTLYKPKWWPTANVCKFHAIWINIFSVWFIHSKMLIYTIANVYVCVRGTLLKLWVRTEESFIILLYMGRCVCVEIGKPHCKWTSPFPTTTNNFEGCISVKIKLAIKPIPFCFYDLIVHWDGRKLCCRIHLGSLDLRRYINVSNAHSINARTLQSLAAVALILIPIPIHSPSDALAKHRLIANYILQSEV